MRRTLRGRTRAESRAREAIELLTKTRPELDRVEILKEVARNAGLRRAVLIARDLGLSAAQGVRAEARIAFEDTGVYQCGYGLLGPSRLGECVAHRIHYAGVLGCPACRDWARP